MKPPARGDIRSRFDAAVSLRSQTKRSLSRMKPPARGDIRSRLHAAVSP